MQGFRQSYDFPRQRIPSSKKDITWAAQCADWIIAQGQAIKDEEELIKLYKVAHGEIPDEFYRKILNPYNTTKEKFTRFPATMRNYDMIAGVVRRYVGEYSRNPHEYTVGANNPEVVFAKNAKLKAEISVILQNEIAARIQQMYAQFVQEGGDPQEFDPQSQFDVEAFVKEFEENYVDEISEQGQNILNVIRDITDDSLLYIKAFADFCTFGECYTYTDVEGQKLIKRTIQPLDAFPIPNNSMFVEDFDMFAERRRMTYQEIMDEYSKYLNPKDAKFLESWYSKGRADAPTALMFDQYEKDYGDICKKFSSEERKFFKDKPIYIRDLNADLYDVWHVVWRGEARKAIVSYVNEAGVVAQRVMPDTYKLNPEAGDLDIQYEYEPQVYECVRIGTRNMAIYPYGARAIAYERNGKLPYNGLMELLPGLGRFSIVETILPYQVFYNIVAYHREMVIAKNKLNILILAKSLLGKVPEDTIYKMIADGVLYIDDENDQGMLRAQQIRMVNADMGQYISQLTNLLMEIKNDANMQVDMTPQRFGEIATSAGKATTEEAIARGSMGSVIIEYMVDKMRERDYARDMDYSKLAWIDGLDTSYRDLSGDLKYISLNVDNHVYADYVIAAKNSIDERDKLNQLKQFAFNASQNGDMKMAVAAITGDNIASIKKLIMRYDEINRQHEEQMKQMEQQTMQMEQEYELQKIQMKGEIDMQITELEGNIKKEIELIKADANMISFNAEVGQENQEAGIDRLNAQRAQVDREKLQLERQKLLLDTYNKEEDRKVKREDMASKERIAKQNKNKYDVKKKK